MFPLCSSEEIAINLIFCETQHLLSVPALQLRISMNMSLWRPDLLEFKDYSPCVYEPFP